MSDLLTAISLVAAAAVALYLLLVVVLALVYQVPNIISTALDRWAVRRYRRIEQR